jgi:hypothetical protein
VIGIATVRAARGLIAVVAVIAVMAVGWLAYPASAATKPTLTLTPVCQDDFGPVWQIWPSGTGWPANTEVRLKVLTGYATGAILGVSTDAAGSFGGFGFGTQGPNIWGFVTVQAFVDTNQNAQLDPGEINTIARIDNPCSAPTLTKEKCRDGGYSALRFNSQGECVAFVQRGSKP